MVKFAEKFYEKTRHKVVMGGYGPFFVVLKTKEKYAVFFLNFSII